MDLAATVAAARLLRGHVGDHGRDLRVGYIALGLDLSNARFVLFDGDLAGGDLLAQGHISGLGRHAALGIIELADFDIRLLDGVLFARAAQVQLADFRQLLGLGHAGPAQVDRTLL